LSINEEIFPGTRHQRCWLHYADIPIMPANGWIPVFERVSAHRFRPALRMAFARAPERRSHSLNPKAPQEVGGMVSVIDPVNHVVTTTIKFAIPGLRAEAIEPVRIALAKDRSTGFVALGPANWGVDHRRRGPRGQQVSSGGQWIWHLAFTPDQKYLLTTNRISNDVSVIDVTALRAIKTVPVGEPPWGCHARTIGRELQRKGSLQVQ
jgi:YVTN family beta-propeller protein